MPSGIVIYNDILLFWEYSNFLIDILFFKTIYLIIKKLLRNFLIMLNKILEISVKFPKFELII